MAAMAAKGKPKLTEEPLPARRPAKKSVLSESEDEEEEPVTATEPESAPEVPLSFSEECPVPRKSIPDADYFIDDGKKWHGKFKKNNHKDLPPNFLAEVQKEQALMPMMTMPSDAPSIGAVSQHSFVS